MEEELVFDKGVLPYDLNFVFIIVRSNLFRRNILFELRNEFVSYDEWRLGPMLSSRETGISNKLYSLASNNSGEIDNLRSDEISWKPKDEYVLWVLSDKL